MGPEASPGEPVVLVSRLGQELEKIIGARLASDKLVVPAMPTVAMKVMTLLKNPNFSMREAAGLIERDAALTAQLFRLVNSAGMAGREPIKSVLHAINRLGAQKLRTFLVSASARKVFTSRDARIAEAARATWEHSLAVAILSRDVVAFSNSGDPDVGYLTGLLHDIGKPVVAGMLLEAESMVQASRPGTQWIGGAEWVAVVQKCHRAVGIAMAEKWGMPDAVTRSVRDCAEYDNSDRLSPANAVRFANALAKQQGIYVGEIDSADNDALVMIGRSLLNLDDDVVERLSTGLKAALQEQLQ